MDTSTLPKSRAEAKATGAKYYFTGEPCKHGHVAPRKTKGACIECLKVEWEKANTERAEYFRQYNQSEAGKEAKQRYYERNRETVIARAQARPLSEKREYQKAWKDRNLTWVRADTKSRRRKHRQASPLWLTRAQKAEMRELYKIAITMTKTTGEQYVVDHIIPLRSENVCGLHVPWNLRVITREENLRKSNKLVDTPSGPAYIDDTKTTNPSDSFLGADDMQTDG
jgi:5-methylcytosine-specific restriction endonuclease McrA